MTSLPLLELQDVSFSYPGHPFIIDSCSFVIEEGKIGLIGANGCGKTTFLQLIVGLIKPVSGTILYQGKTVQSEQEYRQLRKSVGFLFQNSNDQLFSPTVIEDVAFGPLNLGFSPEEARTLAQETLASLGLNSLENRVTHRLSGGE